MLSGIPEVRVGRLSANEITKLASGSLHASLSEKQIATADRIGRELAHVKHAAGLGSALMTGAKAVGKKIGKSFKFERTRALAQPVKVRRTVKGKRRTQTLKGTAAFGHRFMQQPGRAATQMAKDVGPVGLAGLGAYQAVSD